MKKFLKRLVVLVVVLVATPFVLYTVASAASFAVFYESLARTNTNTCTRYYAGVSKGTIWDSGEWHHYVDFKVDNSSSFRRWEVTNAPLPSSLWKKYSTSSIKRVAYRWPSNWRDPFPANDWKICMEKS